eukprot:scaffold12884_cov111-Isochrysis_galbana.AAC.3
MAPLQLRLEPTEVVLATDNGAARARVDSTEESSPQRTAGVLPVYLPELRLLAWVVSAAKTPLGVAAPPITTTAKSCPLQHPPGSFKFQPNPRFIR